MPFPPYRHCGTPCAHRNVMIDMRFRQQTSGVLVRCLRECLRARYAIYAHAVRCPQYTHFSRAQHAQIKQECSLAFLLITQVMLAISDIARSSHACCHVTSSAHMHNYHRGIGYEHDCCPTRVLLPPAWRFTHLQSTMLPDTSAVGPLRNRWLHNSKHSSSGLQTGAAPHGHG
jgi:hypothetical protein